MKLSLHIALFLIIISLIVGIFSSNFLSEKITFPNQETVTITPIPTPTLIPTLTPTPEVIEIKISAIGDCTVGFDSSKIDYDKSYINQSPEDLSYYFNNVVNILSKDDLTIANCEGVFTNSTNKRVKNETPYFSFKGPPEFAEVFKLGSVEYVNLSNNHSYDYWEEGLTDTKENLNKYSVGHFGGCYDKEEIIYFKKDEITIALLGYNVLCLDYKTEANKIIKDLTLASSQSDIQIISIHWGKERTKTPNEDQIWLAHYLIDKGVDLVLGTHPHVIQPIEVYQDKVIVYSLANFTYGGHLNPQPETFIYQQNFKFIDNKLISSDWEIVPCLMYSGKINNYQPTIANETKAKEILDFLLP
ncbi:MAG: CapA family protein [Candidatus Shapirobacteria bacterium]|nr:CapA family protein [Candidatus Shapirobacteria bacterium]